jgi:tetratricopeptide (TPR) repeat protein
VSTLSTTSELPDAERMCFVAMPFGVRQVAGKTQYFDAIYSTIFAPAIARVELPEGGLLRPYRTDRDVTASLIDEDMYRCLEYSRIVLGDLTGENMNVGIELGVRFRSRASGTVLLRQPGTKMPFDISQVKVFDYDLRSPAAARETIATVLRQCLQQNRLDSPVRRTLDQPRDSRVDGLLLQAENAVRGLDVATARARYAAATQLAPNDATIWLRLAIVEKDAGAWSVALEAARKATALAPDYGEAWRERGVAENQIWRRTKVARDVNQPDGVASLKRATELNPKDFDAFASLGGALKRREEYPAALDAYRKSLEVSGNHPYPLLNVLKLEALVEGQLHLARYRAALKRAARVREQQAIESKPPYDPPWSMFDLIEIYLLQGRRADALALMPRALDATDDPSKVQTFRDSLALLDQLSIQLDGLSEVLRTLDETLTGQPT